MQDKQLGFRDLKISQDMDVEVVGMFTLVFINEFNFEYPST